MRRGFLYVLIMGFIIIMWQHLLWAMAYKNYCLRPLAALEKNGQGPPEAEEPWTVERVTGAIENYTISRHEGAALLRYAIMTLDDDIRPFLSDSISSVNEIEKAVGLIKLCGREINRVQTSREFFPYLDTSGLTPDNIGSKVEQLETSVDGTIGECEKLGSIVNETASALGTLKFDTEEKGQELDGLMTKLTVQINMVNGFAQACVGLRNFDPVGKPRTLNINELIRWSVDFLGGRGEIGLRLNIQQELSEETLPVFIDASRAFIIWRNLIQNACDAARGLPPKDVTLTISTRRDGDRTKLVFADNGPGLTQENAARLFNEFFTTKPTGQGVGTMVMHRIIEGNGGVIRLSGETISGVPDRIRAIFAIWLPLDLSEPSPVSPSNAANQSVQSSI